MAPSILDFYPAVQRWFSWSTTKTNVSYLQRKMGASSFVLRTSKFIRKLSKTLSPWIEEVVYVVISFLLLVTLVIILRIYDGRPLTDWQGAISMGTFSVNISLNFIVAVLGTISKANIAVAVEAGLSQAKWLWFSQRRRSLLDYKRFDDASRGPLGSARLLLVTKLRDFASLGALIVIVGLAFDPFLQLLVFYEGMLGDVSNSNASIARSNFYNSGAENPNGNYWTDSYNNTFQQQFISSSVNLNRAITQNVVDVKAGSGFKPNHSCPTVNCTWPAFTSLAVCSRCTNVSSHITTVQVPNTTFQNDDKTTFSSPSIQYSVQVNPGQPPLPDIVDGGYASQFPYPMLENPLGLTTDFGNYSARILAIHATGHPNDTFTFRGSNTLLFSLLALCASTSYTDGESSWESPTITAMECGLSLCTNTYSSAVINSTLAESIIATESIRTADSYSLVPGWIMNTTVGPPSPDSITNLSDPVLRNGSSADAYQPLFVPRTDMSLSGPSDTRDTTITFNITQVALDSLMRQLILSFSDVIPTPNATLPSSLPSNFSTAGFSSLNNASAIKLMALESVLSRSLAREYYGSDRIFGLFDSWYDSGSSRAQRPFSLDPYFDNLAYVITSVMRNNAEPTDYIQGTAQQWAVFIQVRWPVITVPALFVACSAVFLASTIWRTARAGLRPWKENPLPGLITGLKDEHRAKLKAKLDVNGWEENIFEKLCRELVVEMRDPRRPELMA